MPGVYSTKGSSTSASEEEMKLNKLQKGLALTALVAIAIGGAATLSGGNSGSSFNGTFHGGLAAPDASDSSGVDNSVQSQIDKALGRTTSTEAAPPVAAGKSGTFAQSMPAPAPQSAARDATASNAGVAGGAASAANAAPVPPSAPGAGSDPATSTTDRKIVQTANISLQVKEVGAGFEDVNRIATSAGGFVASSSFSYQGDQQVASTTIRVPSARYQDVLGQLRALGVKVDSEGSNASDVTEDYSDLSARLRNLQATETQLLSFLAQAKNVSEVLQVQDRLNTTRGDIERTQGRMNLLDKLSDLSTITVHLRPVVAVTNTHEPRTGIGAEVTKAWEHSLDFIGGIATAVVTVIVFIWWLPIVALVGYALYTRIGRRSFSHAEVAARD